MRERTDENDALGRCVLKCLEISIRMPFCGLLNGKGRLSLDSQVEIGRPLAVAVKFQQCCP